MDAKTIKAQLFQAAATLTGSVVGAIGQGAGLAIDADIAQQATLNIDKEAAELFKIFYSFMVKAHAMNTDAFTDPVAGPAPAPAVNPSGVPNPAPAPVPTPAITPIPNVLGKDGLVGALNNILLPVVGAAVAAGS